MRLLAGMALLSLAACGGNDTYPALAWRAPALTVSSTGTVQATLDVVPGTLAMPPGEIAVCLFQAGGGPAAPVPAGHCSLTAPLPPGCQIPPGAQPFCASAPDCASGCSFTFDFTGANAGGGTGALAGTWSWEARGPTPLRPSGPLPVTQTVP
jgi:hypothetical protein